MPFYKQAKLPLIIKKSNNFVRAKLLIKNNALANRILYLAIRNLTEDDYPIITVKTNELPIEEIGGKQRKSIKESVSLLLNAQIYEGNFDDEDTIGIEITNLFYKVSYRNGVIKLHFSPEMKQHFLDLKKYYTELNYFDVISLPSFYSQRMYEILKSWKEPIGIITYKIEELYNLLDYPKDQRKNFSEIRRFVLEKAKKDIDKHTDLVYTWEPIKEGRKVVAIKFVIGENGKLHDIQQQKQEELARKKKAHEESRKRKPYIKAATECWKGKTLKHGAPCEDMRPHTKKCKMCRIIYKTSVVYSLEFT